MPKRIKRVERRRAKRPETPNAPAVRLPTGTPVDREKFIFAVEAYHAAAAMTMPTENLEDRPIGLHEGKVIVLKDIPINRGMMAALRQLRELGEADAEEYLWRLMHFSELIDARERFGPLIKPAGDGTLSISEAVFHAGATAKMRLVGGETGFISFDVEDAVAIAQKYALEHPDDEDTP